MRRFGIFAVSFAAVLALCSAQNASAQSKKLSYEQAWAKCREDVRGQVNASESAGTGARYARAGACMHNYGYRLKRADRRSLRSS